MMTPEQRIRAQVDKLAKAKALRPSLPTGGDKRTLAEAVNTGANARALAQMNVKQGQAPTGPMRLGDLIRKARKP